MSNEDQARDHYSKGHNGYYLKNFIGHDSRLENIKDWLKEYVKPGQKILDVGCGDTSFSKMLPEFEWTCIDIDAKKDPSIIEHDITKAPYPFVPASFHAVVCSEVLEHLFSPEIVVKEIKRLLKPGGYFIATTPNFDSLENRLNHYSDVLYDKTKFWTVEHIRLYNLHHLGMLIREQDFEGIDVVGNSPCFSTIMVTGTSEVVKWMKKKYNITLTQAEADQFWGRMLPAYCPGVGILSRKKEA